MEVEELMAFLKRMPKHSVIDVTVDVTEHARWKGGERTVVREAFEASGDLTYVEAINDAETVGGVTITLHGRVTE